jgi:hypothetical protein
LLIVDDGSLSEDNSLIFHIGIDIGKVLSHILVILVGRASHLVIPHRLKSFNLSPMEVDFLLNILHLLLSSDLPVLASLLGAATLYHEEDDQSDSGSPNEPFEDGMLKIGVVVLVVVVVLVLSSSILVVSVIIVGVRVNLATLSEGFFVRHSDAIKVIDDHIVTSVVLINTHLFPGFFSARHGHLWFGLDILWIFLICFFRLIVSLESSIGQGLVVTSILQISNLSTYDWNDL